MNKVQKVSVSKKKETATTLPSKKRPKCGATKIPKMSDNSNVVPLPPGTFLDGAPLRSKTFNVGLQQQGLVRAKTTILREPSALDDKIQSDIVNAIVVRNSQFSRNSVDKKTLPKTNIPSLKEEKPTFLQQAVEDVSDAKVSDEQTTSGIQVNDDPQELKSRCRKARPITKSPQKIYRKSKLSNFDSVAIGEKLEDLLMKENVVNDKSPATKRSKDPQEIEVMKAEEMSPPPRAVLIESSSVNSSIDEKKRVLNKKSNAKKIVCSGSKAEAMASPMKARRKNKPAAVKDSNPGEGNDAVASRLTKKGFALKR